MELIGLKKCSTCREIERLLQTQHQAYTYRDIKLNPPTASELAQWLQASGETNLKQFVNTSGLKYRELALKDRWNTLDQAEQLALLATDGMLVKRPILRLDTGAVYVGPAVKRYLTSQMK